MAAETGTAAEGVIHELELSLPRPLNPSQQRLWLMARSNPDVPVYNEAEAVLLAGDLNVDAMEEAMNVVVGRHEALRSTVRIIDGVPHSVIHHSWPFCFEKIDVSDLSLADRQREVDRRVIDEPRVGNDIEANRGIRVALLHLGPQLHVLILMTHYILCDWQSIGVIWRELSALYDSLVTGVPVALAALPISRKYDSVWQQMLDDKSIDEDLAFWEKTLLGAPVLLELPADRPRPATMSNRGGRLRRKLSRGLTRGLRATSEKETASLFAIFASALNTLIYRYTGSDDISLGISLGDSYRPESQSAVGFMLHTQVLRSRLSGDMTFRDLTSRVQETSLELSAHRSVPLDEIVRRLIPEQNPSHSPLFQVMLNWRDRNQHPSFIGLQEREIDHSAAATNTSKCDLSFFVTDAQDEIRLEVEYSTDLFDEDRIARTLSHYQTLLESVVSDPGVSLAEVQVLTSEERQQVLYEWNRTDTPFPSDKCVHQLFEEQVATTPDALAVLFEDKEISYIELNARANLLAQYLRKLGVKPGDSVPTLLHRSILLVISEIAILKSGAVYVPIDPKFPDERKRFMIADCAAKIVLATKDEELPASLGVVRVDVDKPIAANGGEGNLNLSMNGDAVAYIMYTSGSTGQPKGVMVPHRGITRLVVNNGYAKFEAHDRVAFAANPAFDASTLELWAPLLNGGCVVVIDQKVLLEPTRFAEALRLQKISVLWLTVGLFNQYADVLVKELSQLRYLIVGGDVLDVKVIAKLMRNGAPQNLLNGYGPTETTTFAATYRITSASNNLHSIPIGGPIANTRIYILDSRSEPVPIGVAGELYIGGAGVAKGYLNLPALTDEKFLADPFASEPEARMYRTGDLGRWLPNGNIQFLGRNDLQVKIRGFRVELGEIEASIEQNPGVGECVVAVHGDDEPHKRLVAYIVPTDPRNVPTLENLKDALKMRLPSYMIPASFVVVEKMPLTPNGKIDRMALSHSSPAVMRSQAPIAAPRDQIEAKMARIWERVLDVRPIGIRENFFDVGGYSLMIVKLFTQINKAFGRSLPIATIFSSPTIEQLAALVRGRTINSRTLVPIRPSGSKEPLFIVHSYLTYERFRRIVEPDRPLYGLHEREDDLDRVSTSADRVAEYVGQIRELQPRGPYFLIGWCAAGPLTVELARSLRDSGGEVAMLGLIDSEHPSHFVGVRRERRSKSLRQRIWADVRYHRNRRALFADSGMAQYTWSVLLGKASGAWQNFLTNHWQQISGLCRRLGLSLPDFLYNLPTWNIENIEPYDGQISLFRPGYSSDTTSDPTLGWRDIALKGVEVLWIPGDHESMFFEPNLAIFGRLLEEVLERKRCLTNPDLFAGTG